MSASSSKKKVLWFSSSLSTKMGDGNGSERLTFPGVYSCTFDEATGRCDDSEALDKVVDSTLIEQKENRGVDVSNLKLSEQKDKLFGLRTDMLFEILYAPLDGGAQSTQSGSSTTFLSYFRIPIIIHTDKNKGYDCGAYENERFAYFEVMPIAFSVDENDDIYISWEGFFQDCDDEVESGNGLVWSVGVNRVNSDCLQREEVQSFAECTEPAAIFYRGLIGKDHRVGTGIAFSSSPAKRRLIYLSISNRAFGKDGAMEVWVAPEGIHKRSLVLPTPGLPGVSAYQATRRIPDAATIKLNLDGSNLPRGLCQTAYDDGVFCHDFRIEDDGEILEATTAMNEPVFTVKKNIIQESCQLQTSVNGGEEWMSSLSTGLEVLWGADDRPNAVLFGCYGSLPDQGNMTTVLRDGTVSQTLPGAYPGSLLFGIDMPQDDDRGFFWSDDAFTAPQDTPYDQLGYLNERTYEGKESNTGKNVSIVLGCMFVTALALIIKMKYFPSRSSLDKTSVAEQASTKKESSSSIQVEEAPLSPRKVGTKGGVAHKKPSSSKSPRKKTKKVHSAPKMQDLELGEIVSMHSAGVPEKIMVEKDPPVAEIAIDGEDEEENSEDLSRIVEALHGKHGKYVKKSPSMSDLSQKGDLPNPNVSISRHKSPQTSLKHAVDDSGGKSPRQLSPRSGITLPLGTFSSPRGSSLRNGLNSPSASPVRPSRERLNRLRNESCGSLSRGSSSGSLMATPAGLMTRGSFEFPTTPSQSRRLYDSMPDIIDSQLKEYQEFSTKRRGRSKLHASVIADLGACILPDNVSSSDTTNQADATLSPMKAPTWEKVKKPSKRKTKLKRFTSA